MMLKKKSNPWARAKLLLAVPVAMAGIAVFATRQASALTTEVSDCKVSEIFANGQENGSFVASTTDIGQGEGSSFVLKVNQEGRILVDDKVISLSQLSTLLKEASLGDDAVVTILADKGTPVSVIAAVKEVLRQNHVQRVQYQLPQLAGTQSGKLLAKSETLQTQPTQDNLVHTVVDEQPKFPGGEPALMAFIKDNLKYPADCAEEGVQGRVLLSFTVEKDGSISRLEEMRSPDPRLTAEAMRVVNDMPRWTPGKQDGEVVRVKFVLPVTFRLSKDKPAKKASAETQEVFTACEEMPAFPGGDEALMAFVRQNLKYPEECAEQGIQGRVVLSYVIEKDGSISSIEIMRSPDENLAAEAIRVVKSMPQWTPGKQRGQVVRVKYVLPITFRLS